MDIMDVSKGLYVCVKRIDGFHTLMDKPTSSVPAHCKGVSPILNGLFKACVRYFLSKLYFLLNDSPSKIIKNVFYFI